jgi:hypothetical protein
MADKKTYAVSDGVTWVNGAPVSKDRKVELTAAEAAFDLGYARIEPFVEKAAAPVSPAVTPAKTAD